MTYLRIVNNILTKKAILENKNTLYKCKGNTKFQLQGK